MQPLPPNVRVKNGSYHYDLGRDSEGRRRWRKLCRVSDGHHALYKALADVTRPHTKTLGGLFDAYLAKGIQDLAPTTQRDYFGYVSRTLRPVFGETPPGDVHAGHIAQYLQHRLESGSGVVANREIACLSSVYNFGMRRGDCEYNPCKGVRRNKQKPRTRYVRDDEFLKVFEASSEPFQDFLAGLYLTGFRQQDLRSLLRNQLTPNGIRIEESKTGKLRIVSWSESLRFFIMRACTRVDSPYVFTNSHGKPWGQWAVQSVVRRLKAEIGHDWTLHDIRAKAESDHSEGLGLLPLYKRAIRVKPVR